MTSNTLQKNIDNQHDLKYTHRFLQKPGDFSIHLNSTFERECLNDLFFNAPQPASIDQENIISGLFVCKKL